MAFSSSRWGHIEIRGVILHGLVPFGGAWRVLYYLQTKTKVLSGLRVREVIKEKRVYFVYETMRSEGGTMLICASD